VGPAHGAPPSDRPWVPPPHRPLRSSDELHFRVRPTRSSAGGASGVCGASGASHGRPGRCAQPTSNAARTKRTGFARWHRAAAVRLSVAAGPAPHARATKTVVGTTPVSSASAAHKHSAAGGHVRRGEPRLGSLASLSADWRTIAAVLKDGDGGPRRRMSSDHEAGPGDRGLLIGK
jgi:hypothetical protein